MRLFRRIKDPVEGSAQVVSATQYTGGGMWKNAEMTIVVQALGIEPFTLRHKCMAPADRWPHPGAVLPVVFDRRHTDRLDVQWDDVPTGEERGMAQAEALRSALAGGGAAPPGGFPAGVHVETRVIDLSSQPEARDAMLGALEAATGQDLDGDGRVGGAPAAAGPPGGEDRLGALERLARLRDSGALSDEEFAAEKRRLLG